jgi:hypothetical protein
MIPTPLSLVFERPTGARGEQPIHSGEWVDVVRVFEQLRTSVPDDAVWYVALHRRSARRVATPATPERSPQPAAQAVDNPPAVATDRDAPSWAQALLDHVAAV